MRLAISTLLLLAVAALGGGCREKAQRTKDAETKLHDAEATRDSWTGRTIASQSSAQCDRKTWCSRFGNEATCQNIAALTPR